MELTLFGDVAPQSVHCAAVTETEPGELLAVAYAFSYETSPDSRIIAASYRAGSWSETRTIANPVGLPVGNPVIATGQDGNLHLWYVIVHGEQWTEGRIVHAVSEDGGRTWRGHAPIHPRAGLMTKGKPLHASGKVLLPVYDERLWCSHVLIAEDPLGPWTLFGDTTARGKTIQPVLAPLADGRLLMLSRSTTGRVFRSLSENGGYAWSASQPTALPNPNSGIDVLHLQSGELLLAYNPDASGRDRMALATSRDAGRSWSDADIVDEVDGELSYPFMLQTSDTMVHLLYTRNRTGVVHQRIRRNQTVSGERKRPHSGGHAEGD